jgi:hypothetical protein
MVCGSLPLPHQRNRLAEQFYLFCWMFGRTRKGDRLQSPDKEQKKKKVGCIRTVDSSVRVVQDADCSLRG